MTLLFLALAGFAALTALGMFLSSSLEADEPFPPSVTVTAGEAFQLDDFSSRTRVASVPRPQDGVRGHHRPRGDQRA